jgi:hypothetical protein
MKKMNKGNGDLIVNLQEEVVELRETMARYHREMDRHLARVARLLGRIGDQPNAHDQRLDAILDAAEAKLYLGPR